MTESLSDKIFLGNRASDMDTGDTFQVTRVNLNVDSDNYYTAGNDTGQTIEVTCPWGTQAMADSILASLQGHQYQPYTASDALLDPAAEIGDAVTVGGVYSVIASIDTVFDRACAPAISAPASDEIDDEYPYESRERRKTNRQLAQTRSLISKTSEEILLKVENELEGLSSSFSVQLQQIQSQVTGLNGQVSSITQKVDNITLSVTNGSTSSSISLSVDGVVVSSQNIQMNGLVTFTGLANGTTTINGACIQTGTIDANRIDADNLYVNAANITGSLTIGQLPNTVAETSDIPTQVGQLQNNVGYQTSSGVVSIINGTVTADYVEALGVRARYLQGKTVQLLSDSGSLVGAMDIVNTNSGDGLTIGTNRGGIRIETGQSGNIYISSGHGPFLMLGYGDTGSTAMCQLGGGPLVIPGASYGSRAPSGSGEYGEVYFQLE